MAAFAGIFAHLQGFVDARKHGPLHLIAMADRASAANASGLWDFTHYGTTIRPAENACWVTNHQLDMTSAGLGLHTTVVWAFDRRDLARTALDRLIELGATEV